MPSAMGNTGLRPLEAHRVRRDEIGVWRMLHAQDGGMMYALPARDTTLWEVLKASNAHLVHDGVGSLVGGFTVTPLERSLGTFGVIVIRQFRGAGYGKRMVELVAGAALAMNLKTLRVDVYADNASARALFATAGYRDFVWMEKNLTSVSHLVASESKDGQ